MTSKVACVCYLIGETFTAKNGKISTGSIALNPKFNIVFSSRRELFGNPAQNPKTKIIFNDLCGNIDAIFSDK